MTTMPVEPPTYYRQGGQAFPRRTGGIDPSEGVPNQDSVRAMLMPGEFVMTTKAVRGMSRNGDSREGIRNMYSMMRNLEARERKMGLMSETTANYGDVTTQIVREDPEIEAIKLGLLQDAQALANQPVGLPVLDEAGNQVLDADGNP